MLQLLMFFVDILCELFIYCKWASCFIIKYTVKIALLITIAYENNFISES